MYSRDAIRHLTHVRCRALLVPLSIAKHKAWDLIRASGAHMRLSGWKRILLHRIKEWIEHTSRCFQG